MNRQEENFENVGWRTFCGFELLGKRFGIRIDRDIALSEVAGMIPRIAVFCDFDKDLPTFSFITDPEAEYNGLYWKNEYLMDLSPKRFDDPFGISGKIELALAVGLMPDIFMIHAGAVAYDGMGLIMPGKSFAGKTTLVREFLSRGAVYYSDDCAPIDQEGYLYPYSTTLSIRNGAPNGEIHSAESLGVRRAADRIRVNAVVITEFKKGAIFEPVMLSKGEAVLEIARNLFFEPAITLLPNETLSVLSRIAEHSIVIKGVRGDAGEAFEKIIEILAEQKAFENR